MIFGKRLFIGLFSALFTFIALQIIYRKALGLDMITFRDLMNYFSTLTIDNFQFGDALINFVNSITDFSSFDWQTTENFIDALKNIYNILIAFFNYIWGTIKTTYTLMIAVVNDLLVVVYFFRDFFGFLFT